MGTWAIKREATSIARVNNSLRRRSEILKASTAAVSRGALSMVVFLEAGTPRPAGLGWFGAGGQRLGTPSPPHYLKSAQTALELKRPTKQTHAACYELPP